VATVVSKLFNIVCPDLAVFGEKDYQQAAVIKKMVGDLNYGVEIIVAPIVRESDGLALSSRNKYLSSEEREDALAIRKSLLSAISAVADDITNVAELVESATSRISQAGGRVDYVEIVDPDTLNPLLEINDKAVMLVAAYFGATRLIDNVRLSRLSQ
jgi:pantoate--beta-alanine ligase